MQTFYGKRFCYHPEFYTLVTYSFNKFRVKEVRNDEMVKSMQTIIINIREAYQ